MALLNFGAANSAVLDLKFPRHSRIRAVPDLHAGFITLTHFGLHSKEGSCFSCRESKLSTFGEYCGFVFGVKVSFEGNSFSVTY